MTVLLTGGAGYIGTHTAVVLLAAGRDVVLLDNLCNSSRDVLGRLQHISGRTVTLVEADVRDTPRVAQVLRDHACTSVVHFAGLKAVGESVQKPIDYYANNVQGTVSLLQAMHQYRRALAGVQLQRHGVWRAAVPAAGRKAPHVGHQPLWPQQTAHRRNTGRCVRVRPGLARGLPALLQPCGRTSLGSVG
jgi:NAD(P)-dependent dehydrogenase (short-subunit alcohol dehydrogenase family)